MKVEYEQSGDVIKAKLAGELDESAANIVRLSLDSLIENKRFKILILDFENVGFMDSTGVGIVLGRYKKLNRSGQSLLINNPNAQVKKVLKSCGLMELVSEDRA